MKLKLKIVHRWASLVAAVFWLMQAATGVFLVFHWEIDDAFVPGPAAPLDVVRFDRALADLIAVEPGRAIASIWATAGRGGRYDVTVTEPSGMTTSLRLDGHGALLRERSPTEEWTQGGWVKKIASFHQTLLAGDVGHWIVGVSGVLLISNIMLGLKLAWPARGRWGEVLRPRRSRATAATLYSWHRAAGLWLAPIALITVTCGTLLVFEDRVARAIGAQSLAPTTDEPVVAGNVTTVGPGAAIARALETYPGSQLAGVAFPSADAPWYRIRVLQPGESRRVFGTTTLFIGAHSGRVIGDFDALAAPAPRRFMDTLFPIHTGEVAGTGGRLLVVAIGVWLLAMIALGMYLWATRRAAPRRPAQAGIETR